MAERVGPRLLVATHNPGKLREFRALLADTGYEVVGLAELGITEAAPETGATFAENAEQKARYYHALTGLPAIADDSGPEVDAPGFVAVPTGVARYPKEVVRYPRSWVERSYNVTHWSEMPRGGHFAAMEQPELFVDDVRRFFRTQREG